MRNYLKRFQSVFDLIDNSIVLDFKDFEREETITTVD
jgi:hypothetical protein